MSLFERKLHIERIAPPLNDITIFKIESVEKHPTEDKFVCVWSCHYLAGRGVGYGEDRLEALLNAFAIVDRLIRISEADGVTVWWRVKGDKGSFLPPDVNQPKT